MNFLRKISPENIPIYLWLFYTVRILLIFGLHRGGDGFGMVSASMMILVYIPVVIILRYLIIFVMKQYGAYFTKRNILIILGITFLISLYFTPVNIKDFVVYYPVTYVLLILAVLYKTSVPIDYFLYFLLTYISIKVLGGVNILFPGGTTYENLYYAVYLGFIAFGLFLLLSKISRLISTHK